MSSLHANRTQRFENKSGIRQGTVLSGHAAVISKA